MTVGERIKEVREKIGMSQVDFADKINVSKQTLYKYENNLITNIPSDKIEAAAKIGGVSPAYLMGWEEISNEDIGNAFANDNLFEIIGNASPLVFIARCLAFKDGATGSGFGAAAQSGIGSGSPLAARGGDIGLHDAAVGSDKHFHDNGSLVVGA